MQIDDIQYKILAQCIKACRQKVLTNYVFSIFEVQTLILLTQNSM